MKENIKLSASILWGQIASLFFALLAISGGISIFLGEKTDGIIIFAIMFINILIGFHQEFKASKASQKLMQLVQNKVYVLRLGELVEVKTSELVLGDIVHLVAGTVTPVDIEVIESINCFIDDSIRTGETMPKVVVHGEKVFSGACISSGKIIGRVIALGEKSSIAKYRRELESVKKWSSFNVFTNRVIKYIFAISLGVLVLAMILLVVVLGKYTLAHFFVFAIAMLVGVVPEVLPLIVTLILTNESILLSKDKVIVKRLSSLQGLGAVQYLLTDKTGTITENNLRVLAISSADGYAKDSDTFWEVSNDISLGKYEKSPMDNAYDMALDSFVGRIDTKPRAIESFEPFKNDIGYATFTLEGGRKVARGQIDKILQLCSLIKAMDAGAVLKAASVYEQKGMRVIALAESNPSEWQFVGFIAFHDPIKGSAGASLKIAHERGILVKILTGDSKAVAVSVSEELGLLKNEENVISLDTIQVKDLSDAQLQRALVFAKCTPENKLELIDRYLKLGPVAFLGDGINDALALKRADVGIAVDNASDIAKESADIMLLEKDLNPILSGVSMGRRALRNILTYIVYTLSGNAGTFISLLVVSFVYPVLPMLPIQILLNNLLTDLPLMLIITDNPDEYALKHVPHYQPKKIMKRVLIFGLISSIFDFLYFFIFKDIPIAQFQTGWFILSVLTELVLVLSIRSSRTIFKSPALSTPLALGILVSAILPFIFVYTAFIGKLFKFSPLPLQKIGILLLIVLVYIFANEIAKNFMRRKNLYNKPLTPTQIFAK